MDRKSKHSPAQWLIIIVALTFGVLTVKSGGLVLFTEGEFHQQAGNYVPFVVWFNFLAGFAYIATGAGVWRQASWAIWSAVAIAVSTLAVFTLFAIHALDGGSYETRTLGALTLRSGVWVVIAAYLYRSNPRKTPNRS